MAQLFCISFTSYFKLLSSCEFLAAEIHHANHLHLFKQLLDEVDLSFKIQLSAQLHHLGVAFAAGYVMSTTPDGGVCGLSLMSLIPNSS